MNISEQIKTLRKSKKMTQSELAERVSVTKSTISAYENGTRLPSYDVLIKMAQIFHVTTDNLLGYSNKYVIDVTDLTQHQRNTLLEIATTFQRHNQMYKNIRKTDFIETELKLSNPKDEI